MNDEPKLFRDGWWAEYFWLDGYDPNAKDPDEWPIKHGIEIPKYYQTLRFDDMPGPHSLIWFGYSAEGVQRLIAHLNELDKERREIFGSCSFPQNVPTGFVYVILREWPTRIQHIVDAIGDKLPLVWGGWCDAYQRICNLMKKSTENPNVE